jgi:hypothetical protein
MHSCFKQLHPILILTKLLHKFLNMNLQISKTQDNLSVSRVPRPKI